MEKTGKEVKKLDSLPLRFGSFAESFVASEYARSTGFELIHDESIYVHPEYSFMSAHMDRFVLEDSSSSSSSSSSPTRILECKTANPFSSGDWGEAGSDEVPMSYLCQCIWYMAITNLNRVDLAVLFGNSDFRIYEVYRDTELEELIIAKAASFWQDHVLADTPPPAQCESDYQHLFKKVDPGKTVEANSQICQLTSKLQLLNSEIKSKELEISEIKQSIMSHMGESEFLTYQGQILATWKSPKQSYRLDSKKLEQEHPELIPQYQVPIQNSRRLVIKELTNQLEKT